MKIIVYSTKSLLCQFLLSSFKILPVSKCYELSHKIDLIGIAGKKTEVTFSFFFLLCFVLVAAFKWCHFKIELKHNNLTVYSPFFREIFLFLEPLVRCSELRFFLLKFCFKNTLRKAFTSLTVIFRQTYARKIRNNRRTSTYVKMIYRDQ